MPELYHEANKNARVFLATYNVICVDPALEGAAVEVLTLGLGRAEDAAFFDISNDFRTKHIITLF